MRKFVEERFWVLFVLALILGLFFPVPGTFLNFLVLPFLMVILFLTYLKIDYLHIVGHIKQPKLIIYVLVIYLLIIPAIVYGIFQFIDRNLALAFLLLSAIPPGVSTPFLTDLVKGNASFSAAVTFLSYIIAPFTFVFLLYALTHTTIQLDLVGLATTLLIFNFVPLILSQILRRKEKSRIEKMKKHFGLINILLMTVIGYIIIANQATELLSQPITFAITSVFWLYILFILLFFAGYFMAFWRKKEEKTALAISKTFMNNALAIGLAFTFFDPKITILMVFSEVPWTTSLGLFKLLLTKLK